MTNELSITPFLAHLADGKPLCMALLFLDESGSMLPLQSVTERAANDFIEALRKNPATTDALVGVWRFGVELRDMEIAPASSIKPISDYAPAGRTRLYGVLNEGLKSLLALVDKLRAVYRAQFKNELEVRITVGIITDGKNEPSTPDPDGTIDSLRASLGSALEQGFTSILFGIGQQAQPIAEEIGHPTDHDHCMTFKHDSRSVRAATMHFARHTMVSLAPPVRHSQLN